MKFIKRKGFTLIEIAVVILVIGVLIAGISQAMEMFAEASLKSARNLSKSSRLGRVDDLTIWFDATSEKAFDKEKDDGSAVSIWKDSNPRSNIIISSTSSLASLYPSYTLSAINSLPAVSFKKTSSSVGNCVTVPNESFVNSSEDFTLYLIYNPKTLDDGIILEKNNATATTFPFSLELLSGSYKFSVKNSAETISVTSPKQAIIKTPNLIRLSRIKGSQIEIVIDGVSTTQSDTLTSSTLNNAELSIGCRNGSTPANFISGDFGETAFFNRNINVKEKADIEEYLYKKWKMKKFEGTLPAVTAPAPAITCTVPTANTNSDGNSVGLTTTATSLTCKTGFTGSPTYTCTGASNPGNYLAGGTPCTVIVNTCSLAGGAGYSAKSELPVGSASFPCDTGFAGTISYTCPSAGGTATKTGGSCTASSVKCYAIDMAGFRGTNYFDSVGAGAGAPQIFMYTTPSNLNIEKYIGSYLMTPEQSSLLPLVNRLKLYDVYHGSLSYQNGDVDWATYDAIDMSKFPQTSFTSDIQPRSFYPGPGNYSIYGAHIFTKYARILSSGINTFTCDPGFTGNPTYNCSVDGSTLNPTSGTCVANTCTVSAGTGYSAKTLLPIGSATFPCDEAGYTGTISYTCPSSGGAVTNISGSCTSTASTCSLAGGAGYSAKTLLPIGSGSFSCDAGYAGTINYSCPSEGTAMITSGSCTESPIKCYAIDMTGFRGTNYFDTVVINADSQDHLYVSLWGGTTIETNPLVGQLSTNLPLVNRIKLYDVYHGSLSFSSQSYGSDPYYAYYDTIDMSNFPQTLYPSQIYADGWDGYIVQGSHILTKYARVLGYGTNTFTCDSGFTGTLTYKCSVDGSTLNQTSGTCTAN